MLLAADSQLLFQSGNRWPLARQSLASLPGPALTLAGLLGARAPLASCAAAYLGASNGDAPAYFALFADAMAALGVVDVRHVTATPDDDTRAFLARADLVLLAGGDPVVGWGRLGAAGLVDAVRARHAAGAVLVGISAGAIQLGRGFLALVDAEIDVHAPPPWAALEARVRAGDVPTRGYGIPAGGGLVVGPDAPPRAIRRPVVELAWDGAVLARRELAPLD